MTTYFMIISKNMNNSSIQILSSAKCFHDKSTKEYGSAKLREK